MVNSHVMVRKSPKDRVVGPLPNGRTSWLINGGDPNYLLLGSLYYQPKQCTIKVKSLKFTIDLHCLIPPNR